MNSKVDVEIVKYYQSCLRSFESAHEDDKFNEALKIVASLNKNGIRVCYHASICHIIERLVSDYPKPEIIGCLLRALNGAVDAVVVGKNTSRLLEKALLSCQWVEVAQDELVQFQAGQICEYMWLHYPDVLEDPIGSHVLRVFLQFVCGVFVKKDARVYSATDAVVCQPMAADHLDRLGDLVQRFLLSDSVRQLVTNEYMSSVMQVLLAICSVRLPDTFKKVCEHLLAVFCGVVKTKKEKKTNKSEAKKEFEELPESFSNKFHCFLLECLVLHLPSKHSSKSWQRFSKRFLLAPGLEQFVLASLQCGDSCGLLRAAVSITTNADTLSSIARQIKESLCASSSNDLQTGNVFMRLLTELVKKTESVFANQSSLRTYKADLTEIVQFLSRDSQTRSVSLIQLLSIGLNCNRETEEAPTNETTNIKEEKEEQKEEKCERVRVCSIGASLLLQSIFSEFKPIPKSINQMFSDIDPEAALRLCCDGAASRLIESMIQSTNVLDDVKCRFFNRLSPEQMRDLACSALGSRVLDCVWAAGADSSLFTLCKDKLGPHRAELKSHRFGRFIESKFFGYVPKQPKNNKNNNKTDNKQNNINKINQNENRKSNQKFGSNGMSNKINQKRKFDSERDGSNNTSIKKQKMKK